MSENETQPPASIFRMMDEAKGLLEDVRQEMRHISIQTASPVSQATNTNHFGGLGVVIALIIATVCCTAMLTGGIVFAFMTSNQVAEQNAKMGALSARMDKHLSDTDAKLAGMQDYLNAIYVQAPSLRPKEKTQ